MRQYAMADQHADKNVEIEAEKEAEGEKPGVGTDPMRTPGEGGHKQVAPDPEKAKQHDAEREKQQRKTEEEKAERIKNA